MTTSPRFSQQFWSEDVLRADADSQRAAASRPSAALSSSPEVILSCDALAPQGVCTVPSRATRPRGVFVPENYEPNYAYPLVIWLHDAGRSERDIADVLPRISTRNYVGLALRGAARESVPEVAAMAGSAAGTGYAWSHLERDRLAFQDELHASVRELRRDFHIHSERVFLVGAGDGATMAWEVFLARPEWFAGLAVLGGRFPWRRRPLRRFRALRRKPLLLAAGSCDVADRMQVQRIGRLMHAAGLELSLGSPLSYDRSSRAAFRRIDYWIMESIGGCL
jgi:phospholipase/carboxylesterase